MRARRRSVLGKLEMMVLDRLWSDGPSDVKQMHRRIGKPRGITPNTVQSAMERLFRKGLAQRRKIGRAYLYEARTTRKEWVAGAMQDLVERVPGFQADALLSTFVDLAERAGEHSLEKLERLVAERRRRTRGGDS